MRKQMCRQILCLALATITTFSAVISNSSFTVYAKEEDFNDGDGDTNSGGIAEGKPADPSTNSPDDARKWYEQRGIKLTTYILATDSLDYMLRLHPELESYIVHSRPGMTVLDETWDTLDNYDTANKEIPYASVRDLLKLYVEKADYFNTSSEMYLSGI